jgi:hypothetical protein
VIYECSAMSAGQPRPLRARSRTWLVETTLSSSGKVTTHERALERRSRLEQEGDEALQAEACARAQALRQLGDPDAVDSRERARAVSISVLEHLSLVLERCIRPSASLQGESGR